MAGPGEFSGCGYWHIGVLGVGEVVGNETIGRRGREFGVGLTWLMYTESTAM